MTKISNQYSLTNILTADLANSRLGINNVSPTVALDVTGAGKFSSTLQSNGGFIQANQTEIFASAGASNRAYAFSVGNVAAGDFTISQGSTATGGTYTTRLTINPSGNVGIGTSGPNAKLDVAGRITTTGTASNSIGQGSCMLYLDGSGTNNSSKTALQQGIDRFEIYVYDGSSWISALRILNGGSVVIPGSLSKGSGSFRIDHPLKPDTHQLVHSFIEGPQADLIYRGKLTLVNGKAQANIDEVSTMTEGTFEALCREVQCFTTNENGWDLVKGKVIGNIIYIESQNPNSTDEISWMVIGERKDKHMMDTEWTDEQGKVIVEPLKA